MTISLRPAVLSDLPMISAIETISFANPWHPDTFRSLLTRDRVRVLVADQGGQVIGYAVLWWVMDQGELANLAVHPDFQGRGVGSRLLDRVISDALSETVENLFLEVRESNDSARRLYANRGFVQVSVRLGYYQNPREDACVLLKTLVKSRPAEGEGQAPVS